MTTSRHTATDSRSVGCTAAKDARDNRHLLRPPTQQFRQGTSPSTGWAESRLAGKVADEYEDFYDGSWDDEANDKNELGTNGPDTSNSNNYPVTGCGHDGTEKFLTVGGTPQSRSLGSSLGVTVARPNSTGHRPRAREQRLPDRKRRRPAPCTGSPPSSPSWTISRWSATPGRRLAHEVRCGSAVTALHDGQQFGRLHVDER